MSKEAVEAAAGRLRAGYNLKSNICIIVNVAGPDDEIHVMTFRGKEHLMPELPDTYEGIPVTRSKCHQPRFTLPTKPVKITRNILR
jgi:hypothetical protein